MSRQSLPETRSESFGSPFFPSFQKEMHRLFDQFRTGFPLPDTFSNGDYSGAVLPAIDVVETEDAIEVSAEVPGVKEDDLDVSLHGDVLTLKGEKSADHEEKTDSYHVVERRYGSFQRRIPLGFAPEEDAIDARFTDGILKLRIRKPATAKTDVRKIDIKKS